MKKESNLKFLIGFPVGIAMLVLTYIVVYLIGNNQAYLQEVERFSNIEIYGYQFLFAGVFYMIYALLIQNGAKLVNKENNGKAKEIVVFMLNLVILGIVGVVVDKSSLFIGEDVIDLFLGTAIGIIIIICSIYLIMNMVNICKINKKLEKRNK